MVLTFKQTVRISLLLVVLVGTRCSIRAPELKVTGEKTVLMKQVLGSVEDIDMQNWILVSSRTPGFGGAADTSDQRRSVLQAIQNKIFNQDDIREFKRKEYVGENNRGFLEIMTKGEEADSLTRKRIEQVVEEENRDRSVLYERVLALHQQATAEGDSTVQALLADLSQNKTESGTWIETANGEWVRKP